MEKQCSLSVEDYLKAFLENEVKPLWPKGWMQTRSLHVLWLRHKISFEETTLSFYSTFSV